MGGGLMQLVAYGAQDVYLTGSAQITFFKVIYRRHTNFSVEPIPQTFTGAADFGRTVTCTINRNGDLITNMYVNISLAGVEANNNTTNWGYVRRLGLAIVQHYKIEIGGSKIDEQYGDWLNIWYELSHKVGQERGFAKMIGDVPELTTINGNNKPEYHLYIPLQFWFNRNNGLALPLIALQYHDVRITIDFRPAAQCINFSNDVTNDGKVAVKPIISMNDAQLVIDYVYLDSEERKRFAQASHEYLIEQLQFTGSETLSSTNNKYRLNFNHPCKYLIWAPHLEKYNTPNSYLSYVNNNDWQSAKDNFAKLLWIASRKGLVRNEDSNTWVVSAGSGSGEIIAPVLSTAWSADITSLVDAQLISTNFLSVSEDITPIQLENVVLLSNNITDDLLSLTADEIVYKYKTGTDNTNHGEEFLNQKSTTVIDIFNYGNFINGTDNPVTVAKLQLNGTDRFQERDGYYFNYVQPWQHFSNTPADGINVYSFALKPEDHQPSGSCNFSRIDNATLNVAVGLNNVPSNNANNYINTYLNGSNSNSILNIYAVNYNVLRIMSGMAGAAYSN